MVTNLWVVKIVWRAMIRSPAARAPFAPAARRSLSTGYGPVVRAFFRLLPCSGPTGAARPRESAQTPVPSRARGFCLPARGSRPGADCLLARARRRLRTPTPQRRASDPALRAQLRHVDPAGTAASGQAMVRCDLATDWAFADKDAPLYAHMETMQRLPVPELDSSLAMYLHSVRPFLTEPEFEEYQVRPPRRAQTLRGASAAA